jgi:hypothetical protein
MAEIERSLRRMYSAPFEIRFTDNVKELVNFKIVEVKR